MRARAPGIPMNGARLSLALAADMFALPEGGIVVFGADGATDLSALPRDRVQVVCHTKPDFDTLAANGYRVTTDAPEQAALAVVFIPRAKAQARAMLARAAAVSDGAMVIDGQKTDGIDSIFRDMRARAVCSPAYSKAHGKLFVASGARGALDDWAVAGPVENRDGFLTLPGVFSADGIDPGSRLLAEALPATLGKRVVDLGAGWGYLAQKLLERDTVEAIDLVEANAEALDCARLNVTDARARFHWADATTWRPETKVDTVVMNPPFHEGRKGLPDLGRAFIRNAGAMLIPSGHLWMVANRHLPYEGELSERFGYVEEFGGDTRFKLLHAARPSRKRR